MRYKKYQPSPALQPYVVAYYLWESEQPLLRPFSITSPANNSLAVVFNYGDSYCLYNHLNPGTVLPAQFLSGQSTAPYTLLLEGQIKMAGIIFRGSSIQRFFQLPYLGEFQNDRVDLVDLIGSEGALMNEQLAEAKTPEQKIQILEKFLRTRLSGSTAALSLSERAQNIIYQRRGVLKMDALAQQLHVSPRQLRRSFKAAVGINPKFAARLKRFNYINLCLTQNPNFSWQMFLDQGLFYDQSHFIKDYQEFFGERPTIQIRTNRQVARELTA